MTGDRVRECRLPRAVRPNKDVNFTSPDGQIDPTKDLHAAEDDLNARSVEDHFSLLSCLRRIVHYNTVLTQIVDPRLRVTNLCRGS